MPMLRSTLLALAFLWASAACTTSSGARHAPRGAAIDAEKATLSVTNNNWSNVTVFLVRGGQRVRMGMVTTMRTARFVIPKVFLRAAGDVRILVDPIGSSDSFQSSGFHVRPGQEVEFVVQNHLATSSVSIW